MVIFTVVLFVFPLQYMAIHSNNSTKFMKLSHRKFSHLVQNRENICTRSIWHIQYAISLYHTNTLQYLATSLQAVELCQSNLRQTGLSRTIYDEMACIKFKCVSKPVYSQSIESSKLYLIVEVLLTTSRVRIKHNISQIHMKYCLPEIWQHKIPNEKMKWIYIM